MRPSRLLDSALRHHQAGNLHEAGRLYRAILGDHPRHADALHLLGLVAHQRGRTAEAIGLIQRAIAQAPDNAPYHNNLGETLRAAGRLEDAALAYRRAIALAPDYAQAQCNLGMVLHQTGDLAGALRALRTAARLGRSDADMQNNVGICLQSMGQPDEALRCFRGALAANPRHGLACHNLAVALKQSDACGQAREHAERAVRTLPDSAGVHANLAEICLAIGDLRAAARACRRAVGLDPCETATYLTLHRVMRRQGRLEEACEVLRKALAIDPTLVAAHNDLGMTLMALGRTDEAIAALEQALAIDPRFTISYENLTRCRRFSVADGALLSRMQTLLDQRDIDDAGRCSLNFALGKALDDGGKSAAAFAHFREANALARAEMTFDAEAHDRWVERLMASFSVERVRALAAYGSPSTVPIFVLGMPRSGTTLVEQILASHPAVRGAGELTHFYDLARELPRRLRSPAPYPQCVAGLDAPAIARIAESYLRKIGDGGGEAEHVTDKMPLNFLHLGLIGIVFPNARIVHCRRDVRDVCLSLYFQHFASGNAFAYDLYEIGRYHRAYARIMDHWRTVLRNPVFDLDHASLVADQEGVTRALLAFCGLDWNARCLAYHETRRAVSTASAWQVRQPIDARTVGRWRRYEAYLAPLDAGLSAAPRP